MEIFNTSESRDNMVAEAITNAFSSFASIIIIVVLTVWGIKTHYPLAFTLCFPVTLFTGLRWYDVFNTPESLAVSVALIFYSFIMAGSAIFAMFVPEDKEGEK